MTRTLWVALGTLLLVSMVTGLQRPPPKYSQDMMPLTSFSCRDKIIGGYYADPETDCQMFHVCVKVPGQGVQDYKFLCPNDTAFDQENQICDDWYNIDCEASTLYYSDNFDLYRIGSDFPGANQEPRLPNNNINNAVSENDDDFYLQKSDRGENVGSDLLRGSHSSNFFSNKNRGREDEDDVKEDYHSKNTNRNGVRKLLTGKRPIATTLAPVVSESTAAQYQPRQHNNYNSGRVSQFRGHQRDQQTSVSTEAPTRQTEAYNRQPFQQRSFYSPTTPKIETPSTTQKVEFFRNYNPTTKRSYYENTQNYNAQTTTIIPQTTRIYQTPRAPATTQPTTVFYETTANAEKNNFYETQKLYQINTGGAFNQYDDSNDEFFKTAHSQNLGASVFNSLQKTYKSLNTSVSSSYNFNPTVKPTTINVQTQTYPTTFAPTFYTTTTGKPFQQQNYYTTPKVQPPQQTYQQNYYNPSTELNGVTKAAPQYTPTTLRPYHQTFAQTSGTTLQQYNPTTIKPLQQQYNNPSPQQNYQRNNQQQNYQQNSSPQQNYQQNASPQQNYQQNSSPQQNYQQNASPQQNYQRNTSPQQNYQQNTSPQQNSSPQQNYQQNTSPQYQQPSNFQSQRNTGSAQAYQQKPQNLQSKQQFQQPQRNSAQFQQTTSYYNPTTQRSFQQAQTTIASRGRGTTQDTTEKPRPFTQPDKKDEKKEKDQYDYAYYDDGTQSEYDSLEPLEEFKRTKSKN